MSAKRIWIYVSILLSVASVVYMCLIRFGYFRIRAMKKADPLQYVQNYPNLPRASDNRVVIAFTIDANNIQSIKPFLSSILSQNVRVDDIAINLPYKDLGLIPTEWKSFLTPYGTSNDYGDASSLVTAAMREPEADTLIILVEPGYIYAEGFVQSMVSLSKKYPTSIIDIGSAGMLIRPQFFNEQVGQCNVNSNYNNHEWATICSPNNIKHVNLKQYYTY